MELNRAVIGVFLLASAILAPVATATEFQGIGFLEVQDNTSRVSALSPDGSTVVGSSELVYDYPGFDPPISWSDGRRAFRWTTSGMSQISGGIAATRWFDSPAAVSSGGSVIVGMQQGSNRISPLAGSDTIYLPHAYVWTPDQGRLPIQAITNHGHPIYPKARSNDGAVWVGEAGNETNPGNGTEAFRYAMNTGPVGLGYLPGGGPSATGWSAGHSSAQGVSADGSVVVGYSASANSLNQPWQGGPLQNDAFSGFEAFVWTETAGMIGLGDLPGGYFDSSASAVSANGQVIVGTGTSAAGAEAFRWTSQTGMTGLGYLNSQAPGSAALSASGDGSIIVGQSILRRELASEPIGGIVPIYNDIYAAFIWDAQHGMRNLQSVLATDYGLDLTGWKLTSAVDISDDGLVIAGNGINPLGQEEGWVVRLEAIPEPATLALFVLGACGVALSRKRLLARRSRQSVAVTAQSRTGEAPT
jgi:probable HAF family extracellular repeat protein